MTTTISAFKSWATTPNPTKPIISVVIPAYNEAERILPTIGAIAAQMSIRSEPWELIIADDGSKDNTVELLTDLGYPNLRVLVAEKNGGKGMAVRRGILASQGEYILFADADQSTPIEQFDSLLGPLLDGADIAIGSRAQLSAEQTKKSPLRRLMSFGLAKVVRYGFRISAKDTQCGFKLFKRECAQDLFGLGLIDGFSFDLEILYLAAKRGYKTVEIPVEWIDAPGSKVEATKVAVKFLIDLCVIRANDIQGKYNFSKAQTPGTTNRK